MLLELNNIFELQISSVGNSTKKVGFIAKAIDFFNWFNVTVGFINKSAKSVNLDLANQLVTYKGIKSVLLEGKDRLQGVPELDQIFADINHVLAKHIKTLHKLEKFGEKYGRYHHFLKAIAVMNASCHLNKEIIEELYDLSRLTRKLKAKKTIETTELANTAAAITASTLLHIHGH